MESLRDAPAVDFVARNEFDFTVKDVAEGRHWPAMNGLSYRNATASSSTMPSGRSSRTWTSCPSSPTSTSAT